MRCVRCGGRGKVRDGEEGGCRIWKGGGGEALVTVKGGGWRGAEGGRKVGDFNPHGEGLHDGLETIAGGAGWDRFMLSLVIGGLNRTRDVRETRRKRRRILRPEHRSFVSSPTKLLVSLSLSLPTPSVDRITTCGICRAVSREPSAANPGTMPPFSYALGSEEALKRRRRAAAIRGYTMPRADNVSCETTVSTKFTLPAALLQALALTASHTSARGVVRCCVPEV